MPRQARVHVAMIAMIVASSLNLLWLLPNLPAWRVWMALALLAALVVPWTVMLALRFRPGAGEGPWPRQDRAIIWMINGALIGGFWTCMPYADPGLRMIVVMFHCAMVTGEVLAVGRRQPRQQLITYAPASLLLSSAIYYAVNWEHWSALLILFLVSHALVVRALARALQRLLDRLSAA